MLLLHQAGSVKVGEVVRYTLTYTPSQDRILPTPSHLRLKIKNTSAIPLRAAYLHGPYTLHVSAYPSTFNPNHKVEEPKKYGVPDFEPLLKAGGHWTSELTVPDHIRETGATFASGRASAENRRPRRSDDSREDHHDQNGKKSVTWIIEVASQILFSNSAAVHFEVLVGRDERSLELGFAAVAGHGHGAPGQMADYKNRKDARKQLGAHPQKGVYSRAVKLLCEDTEALWDKPALPKKQDIKDGEKRRDDKEKSGKMKKKKIHLVVLTHGLHSNIGADMLYLKESIDATVKQARLDARKRKAKYKAKQREQAGQTAKTSDDKTSDNKDASTAPLTGGQEELQDNDDDGSDDEEQTIVRGFTGNAVRTERGIQYLGKRLAKYILHFTYPDQPFLPVKKSMSRNFADTFKSSSTKEARDGMPAHDGSTIHIASEQSLQKEDDLPYTFTRISFVGHSLGGLIQTYAVAYIQKHAPHFFEQVEPINFICMASPLLGLSNENPMYVKFALDFGLVGRTGQDLGLTWRAPTLAKSGWSNLVSGFSTGEKTDKEKEADPGAKPLLRILPTGPAHTVLKMFRNRTVYANVVNDGIVPLRTSCLLFLDWRGLGKVDKARRENGLLGTMAEWGWAELTGTNALSKVAKYGDISAEEENGEDDDSGTNTPTQHGDGETVPQPAEDTTTDDNKRTTANAVSSAEPDQAQFIENQNHATSSGESGGGFFDSFINFLRPGKSPQSRKITRALRRGQTMSPSPSGSFSEEASKRQKNDKDDTHADRRNSIISNGSTNNPTMLHPHSAAKRRPGVARGFSTEHDAVAPPRTSIFESASDILHPPIPSTTWITDPASRSRTIFHDRVYHPEDIPPPPAARRPTLGRSLSSLRSFSHDSTSQRSLSTLRDGHPPPMIRASTSTSTHQLTQEPTNHSSSSADTHTVSMKVEEKIARAYHRDLSWRKVLVRLEPDAHNNMIVRRMFANAYGWPVVKHVCDTHFAGTWTAETRDEDEAGIDRAEGLPAGGPLGDEGEEVRGQRDTEAPVRSRSEMGEEGDELGALGAVGTGVEKHRQGSGVKEDDERRASGTESGSASATTAWDDAYFEGDSDGDDGDDDDDEDTYGRRFQKLVGALGIRGGAHAPASPTSPFASVKPAAAQTPAQKTDRRTPATKDDRIIDSIGKKDQWKDKNHIAHIRSSSGSGLHAQPLLSSDTANGSFVPASPSSPSSKGVDKVSRLVAVAAGSDLPLEVTETGGKGGSQDKGKGDTVARAGNVGVGLEQSG